MGSLRESFPSQRELADIRRKDETIPFSKELVEDAVSRFSTPFYLYSEEKIREQCKNLKSCFGRISPKAYKNFFAVKATPTPGILKIMKEEGFGADCSSMAELMLAKRCGFSGEDIMFTSNNTPSEEFRKAAEMGAVINLDDISLLEFCAFFLPRKALPALISFRFNPGPERTGNVIIGDPKEAKYGLSKRQLFTAYKKAREMGATRFALHTMVISNCVDYVELVETSRMLFTLCKELYEELGIVLEFVNLGGGLGIPYKIDQEILDLTKVRKGVQAALDGVLPTILKESLRIATECGRYITGPAGYLVTTVQHQKRIYKNYIGVDACMANLMRPGMYGAYHHITCIPVDNEKLLSNDATFLRQKDMKDGRVDNSNEMKQAGYDVAKYSQLYDITEGLCENNDKFAIDRYLFTNPRSGDVCLIHDAGAHGHSMGFNYNGKLRSAEVLYAEKGEFSLIRRAENYDDLFACIQGK